MASQFPSLVKGCHYYQGVDHIRVGQILILRRNPQNPYDSNAIEARTESGLMVGHINRSDAALFAPLMDQGASATASVTEVIPSPASLKLLIHFEDDLLVTPPTHSAPPVLASPPRPSTPPPRPGGFTYTYAPDPAPRIPPPGEPLPCPPVIPNENPQILPPLLPTSAPPPPPRLLTAASQAQKRFPIANRPMEGNTPKKPSERFEEETGINMNASKLLREVRFEIDHPFLSELLFPKVGGNYSPYFITAAYGTVLLLLFTGAPPVLTLCAMAFALLYTLWMYINPLR